MQKLKFTAFLVVFSMATILGQTEKLKITQLKDNFYVYTTYNNYQNSLLPAHGMYFITNAGAVLLDTPWDTTQFQPLLDSIKVKHNKEVLMCIATHWHSDRTEGLEYYKQKGIKTYTTALTDQLSKKNNKKRAEFTIEKDTIFTVAGHTFETYYPGEGHTADNIVLWFKEQKILYGGCLIKGADAENLGYMGDANPNEYATTLKNVKKKYPKPNHIIISHSSWLNKSSLKHSIMLANRLKRKAVR
jgi:metallo-beta-lactamase class B